MTQYHCIFQIIKITSRALGDAQLWLRLENTAHFQMRLTLAPRTIYKSSNVSPDSIAMFPSFPERNTTHKPAVAYLIINAHVYSVLPEAMHLHISSFCASPLNALSLNFLLLLSWNQVVLTTIMHLKAPCCNLRTYCKGWLVLNGYILQGRWGIAFLCLSLIFNKTFVRRLSTKRDQHFSFHVYILVEIWD